MRSATSPPRRAGPTRCSPSACADRRCLSSATSSRHTKDAVHKAQTIPSWPAECPPLAGYPLCTTRGAASSADESAKAIGPYAAIAAPSRRSYGSATTRERSATHQNERDRVAGRPTRSRDATIRPRPTAVKLCARWLRAEEGFNAEETQIRSIPCQIDGHRSGGGRELDRRARRLD